MAPLVWNMPEMNEALPIRALDELSATIEKGASIRKSGRQIFYVHRDNVRQYYEIDQSGKLHGFWNLTWPWKWRRETKLFKEIVDCFHSKFERYI